MTATMAPPPVPGFRPGAPSPAPAFRFGGTLPAEQLTERHRPGTLADVVGQGAAVYQLGTFLEAPSPRAFLLAGPTGVGKTTAARALAADLGVDPDWGLHFIRSAEVDYQAVEDALRMLRHSCPVGSGWKMVIVDEADLMTPKASHAWLSALEDLPPRSVVVFTTNSPERFPDRFLDRCERVDFAADGATLAQDAQALVDRIWRAELGRDDAPRVGELPNVVDRCGLLSFRRCVAALDPLIRAGASGRSPGRPAPPPAAPPRTVRFPAPAAPTSSPRHPAPTPRPPRPRPRPTKPPASPPPPGVEKVDARLAEIAAEKERLGFLLLELDAREAELKRKRRDLARRK